MAHSKPTIDQAVADAVLQGLSQTPKSLPSWLFYDETGDKLFQQIMRMPEYYPTRCEYDILQQHKGELLKYLSGQRSAPFRLIELGAGDGLKTEILLSHFMQNNANFSYLPVDISANALEQLSRRLRSKWQQLRMTPLNKSYDQALDSLRDEGEKKVILFMGANIGNFTTAEAAQFLKRLVLPLSGEDMLLIGFDLKKDPRVIEEAYDDPRGLTAQFNLNILSRLNRELGAEFDLDKFGHFPCYDPVFGTMKSFLISLKHQVVYIEAFDKAIPFDLWEPVHTEVSQKYDMAMIEKLMALSGLQITEVFYDSNVWFCDVLVSVR